VDGGRCGQEFFLNIHRNLLIYDYWQFQFHIKKFHFMIQTMIYFKD